MFGGGVVYVGGAAGAATGDISLCAGGTAAGAQAPGAGYWCWWCSSCGPCGAAWCCSGAEAGAGGGADVPSLFLLKQKIHGTKIKTIATTVDRTAMAMMAGWGSAEFEPLLFGELLELAGPEFGPAWFPPVGDDWGGPETDPVPCDELDRGRSPFLSLCPLPKLSQPHWCSSRLLPCRSQSPGVPVP